MYNHLTTCEPLRPSLGKRIDLSDYQDPSQPLVSSVVVAPVSVIQPSPVTASPAVAVAEPVLSYAPVAAASFPLHSPSLLETGVPVGKETSWGQLLERPHLWGRSRCWGALASPEGWVLLMLLAQGLLSGSPPALQGRPSLLIGLWLLRSHFSNEAAEGRGSELRNAASWDCSTPGCQVLAEGALLSLVTCEPAGPSAGPALLLAMHCL